MFDRVIALRCWNRAEPINLGSGQGEAFFLILTQLMQLMYAVTTAVKDRVHEHLVLCLKPLIDGLLQ
jgi:hypothetical protein